MKLHDVLDLEPEAAVDVDTNRAICDGTMFVVVVGDVNDKDKSFGNLFQCRLCKRDDLGFDNSKIVDLTPTMRLVAVVR
jgi:hypothetical protein